MGLPETLEELTGTYYLKTELVKMCKDFKLPVSGSKQDLINYLSSFLENKPIQKAKTGSKKMSEDRIIAREEIIDPCYSNDQKHRIFFQKEIGSHFKYNVQFINWMKENRGKRTYDDAINEWSRLYSEKKQGVKYRIGEQFKYNQYIRDFFKDNPGLSIMECTICWNYKKNVTGNHRYEKEDLRLSGLLNDIGATQSA